LFAIEKYMKFRFANSHSINIWDTEYDRITVSEGKITFVRPGGKVEVPKEWLEGSWSRPEALSLKDCSVKATSLNSGKVCVQEAGTHNRQTSVSACCGAELKFEKAEKLDVPFVKLTNQVEALRKDLIQFSSETKERMAPLLDLPLEVDMFRNLSDIFSMRQKEMQADLDEVEHKVCRLLEDVSGEEGLQKPVKRDEKKSCGPLRKGKYK